jgi:transposase
MSTTAKQTKINTAAKAEVTKNIASTGATSGGARSTVASGTKAEGASPKGRSYILKRAGSGKAPVVLDAQASAPQAMTPSAPATAPAAPAGNGMKADIIYLGMDVHADRQVVVVQVDATTPKPAQSMDIKALHVFAGKQLQQAHRVVACYEAGPCGYSLCRALIALGIECMVVRPKCWDEFGSKVKTDARDARQLCEALERHTKGNTNALSVVRLPTVAEELERGITRQRDALVGSRTRIAAQGRSAVLFNVHSQRMKGQWWKPRAWSRWEKVLSAVLLDLLAPLHRVLVIIDEQIEQLTARIEGVAQERATRSILPKGVGELTSEIIAREVCDWSRFNNRRQVASFTGLCPTEYSSGGTRRQGGINKHGNQLLRKHLCEAVWRLIKYQPGWIRLERLKEKMAAGSGAKRKQLVAALARMLAIDLWRLNTGRSTLASLGFIAAAPAVIAQPARSSANAPINPENPA